MDSFSYIGCWCGCINISNWDTIKQWFITLWDNPMLAGADQFWTGLKDLFKRGYEWLQEKWQSISNFLLLLFWQS